VAPRRLRRPGVRGAPLETLAELRPGSGEVSDVLPGAPLNFNALLQEMGAGHARVVVVTTGGEHLQGQIEPDRR
jgi:hypothetical protein